MDYFHCAEFACIYERFDPLLLARFLHVSGTGGACRIARALYDRPQRLVGRYGRSFAAGELVFREGDRGKDAYYLLEGRVGV